MLRVGILLLLVSACAESQTTFSKQTFVYKSVDDTFIKADVYRLPGQESRPVIL